MKIKSIGIIGGNGSMGKWFHGFFEKAGYPVEISDLNTQLTNEALAKRCSVVILSTPIDVAIHLSKSLGPLMKPDQLLMDLCSQKEDIVREMTVHSCCSVLGTHPMFGPYTDTMKGQNIILCPGRGNDFTAWANDLFSNAGAHVTELDPVEHDRHMALVQGLTHLISICMARTLQKMNLHPTDVFSISTPIFRINSDIMGRVFAQDPDLYATLVGENRYVKEVLELFLSSLDEGTKTLIEGSHVEGAEFIRKINSFIGDYRDKALDRSNLFMNIILNE